MDGAWGRTTGIDVAPSAASASSRWLVAAGAAVALLTVVRVVFLVGANLNLDFEEAQYWMWAQAPAWGYWSKPPLVAWLIAATTSVCGDGEACVRLASPLLHAVTALTVGALGRMLAGPTVGFWSAIAYATLPGVSLSAILITTDVPLLLCWAAALAAFVRWRDSDRWPWAAACGLAFGAGMLGKYSMALFAPSLALYLALSSRRLRPRHLALAVGLAAIVIAPNAAWNVAHQFGTVRHSLSRVEPGQALSVSERIGETLYFLLGQVAVFGPVGWVCLIALVLRRRSSPDDTRLLLGCFTVVPLVVAVIVSFVARANANWAAPAYVAGTVLVISELLAANRAWVVRTSCALALALCLAIYAALAFVPTVILPGGTSIPVQARLQGWPELGRRVAARAAALDDARVLVDRRWLAAIVGYYGRLPQERLVEWNPDGVTRTHFQLRTHLEAGDPGPLLFLSYTPDPKGVLLHFTHAELVDTVAVPLADGLERTHWLFALRGFRGYGLAAPADAMSPILPRDLPP